MIVIKNKAIIWIAILITGVMVVCNTRCDNSVSDPTASLILAQRIDNVSKCKNGCSVVIGDSNVFWYDWKFIPGDVCNMGIGGTRINFVINNIDNIVALNPSQLIVWTGQNDHKRPMANIYADYDLLFAEIKKLSCPVYILSVHPYNGLNNDNALMMQINDYLRVHDGEGYVFIDIYNDIQLCGSDCFLNVGHLNSIGFGVIKSRVLESI